MGFINLFKSKDVQADSLWNVLESEEDLQKAVQNSFEKQVVVFKHSTRCMISRMVLGKFEKEMHNFERPNMEYYFLDLLKYRKLSNEIAAQFEVAHQSPQIIVLKNGESVYSSSHSNIDFNAIPK